MSVVVKPIVKLSPETVSRIAAGEVIQRPANAIKELIENSLDAGASTITVTVADGGLRSFSVQDDGHGIRLEDLPILCERHTTSKLVSFDDLRSIGTFGFRGEALASISFVSNVTVTTMTANQPCAYRAKYRDGVFEDNKTPQPCAGNRGTIILAENIFYNLKQRREALKNPADELKKIIHVVQRYALHYSGKTFVLKKAGSNASAEVITQKGASLEANVSALYGQDAGANLIRISAADPTLDVTIDACVSSINYGGKRFVFVLFINHRLVECAPLKKLIRDLYGRLLAKGKHPFVYLSLSMKPENVDVNVHPTKSVVRFRFEDQILSRVGLILDEKLKSVDVSRPVQVTSQAHLVPSHVNGDDDPAWRSVRVDSREQKLDAFLVRSESSSSGFQSGNLTGSSSQQVSSLMPSLGAAPLSQFAPTAAASQMRLMNKRPRTELTSVLELMDEIGQCGHAALADVFREHAFVGCVDSNRCAIQYRLNLYLIDVPVVTRAFFYELILSGVQNFQPVALSPPPAVRSLLRMNMELNKSAKFDALGEAEQNDLLTTLEAVLAKPRRREMLKEFFALEISDDLELRSLPLVLQNYTPDMTALPSLMLRLCTKVSYQVEKECVRDLSNELARFFSLQTIEPAWAADGEPVELYNRAQRAKVIEHVVFSSMRGADFRPPKTLASDGAVRQIASIDQLYKVFERC